MKGVLTLDYLERIGSKRRQLLSLFSQGECVCASDSSLDFDVRHSKSNNQPPYQPLPFANAFVRARHKYYNILIQDGHKILPPNNNTTTNNLNYLNQFLL